MSHQLAEFLIKLASDPELQKSYAKQPDEVATRHGLSEADKTALSSGNEGTILAHIAGPGGAAAPKLILGKLILGQKRP